jgi:molecular chaperone HtpG
MSAVAEKQTLAFQTEVEQLLHLMIHSLYSNKDVFLRELISNASDACDKLRFEAISRDALYEGDSDLAIRVELDPEARTVSVIDNGIGMTRDEVIEHIGTIAHSGTRQFIESLTGDQSKDAQLIGQFGVGFYSSFIVADKVTLETRRAGELPEQGVRWESSGEGQYTVESIECPQRGTRVTLQLREGEDEFLDAWRLRSIITRYSDHIGFPVMMRKTMAAGEAEDQSTTELEQVNQASALWTRPKSEISDEEYKSFYKHVAHDFDEPLAWMHTRVEGRQEYTSLIYLPRRAPFDLYDRDARYGMKLYVQRVFIMDDAEELLPRYLRFVRGVVDSSDLPLNISREILQSNRIIDGIRSATVKKVLGLLENMAEKEPENYATFWGAFGQVLKEGPAEDPANREQIARLLRFASTRAGDPGQVVSLGDYVARMNEGQNKIYYLTADSHQAAANSPHLEIFKRKGIEVLLLSDRVDEWLVAHLTEFDGKPLQSIAKGELDLGEIESEQDRKAEEEAADRAAPIIAKVKTALGERVEDVRVSRRLTDSPACIVLADHEMSLHVQHLLRQAGHALPVSKPVLEINVSHPIVRRLAEEQEPERIADWSLLLLDQAILAEGGQLEDAAGFVTRLNRMLSGAAERA